jgi:hypothetical protein
MLSAQSADLTMAVLSLNGVEIATKTSAPFSFSSADISELDTLIPGRHELSIVGTLGTEEQSVSVNIRKDGEMTATYAAVNYVYNDTPYAVDSTTEVGGVMYNAKAGGWIDIAGNAEIAGTELDTLYTRELSGPSVNIAHNVSNGTYEVKLHLAEIWFNGTSRPGVGARVMDVSIEGELVADDLDVFAEVGYLSAYDIVESAVEVTDGELNIDLTGIVQNAKINAYSIQRVVNAWDDEDSDGVYNADDKCLGTPIDADVDDDGCALPVAPPPAGNPVKIDGGIFIEANGLLAVEMESTDHPTGWAFESGRNATGQGYLNMTGRQAAWQPNNVTEIITTRIRITNPGRYRFVWRSLITKPGVPSTEHNDSYLKIVADRFYGQKGDNIVCPRVLQDGNTCAPSGRALEGEAIGGYFKIWRSGSPIDEWNWITNTSDNDGHSVFADFDSAGEYEVIIANRSDFHAIDRFVLFRDGNDTDNVSLSDATDTELAESAREQ